MASKHIVQQGECLSSIAHHYGLAHWRVIYDHPENAAFKAKRPNPDLIYPGDELYIPGQESREDVLGHDKRHIFVTTRPPTFLNIRIQNLGKEPIANAPYELHLDALQLKGATDGEGWVRSRIPPWTGNGVLRIWPNALDAETTIDWTIRLGHLDPLETVSGIKGRLNNLGYYRGPMDETTDEHYDTAVREFQEDHDLVVDGIVGPKTRATLSQEHRV